MTICTRYRQFSTAVVLITLSNITMSQQNFDVNDCIISGMKGIASDSAARMVKEACERKQQEQPEWKVNEYMKQLGAVAAGITIELVEFSFSEAPGFHSATYRNTDSEKSVTFIRLKVTPGPALGQDCDYTETKFEVFRVSVPPGKQIKLIYPSRGGNVSCTTLTTVFAREALATDVPSPRAVKALAKDPLIIERKLGSTAR